MRVIVYPSDSAGCGHYRLRWPVDVLRKAGHTISVRPEDPLDIRNDVAVFQRPMSDWLADVIPNLRAQGVAVVVDIDDDLLSIHPRNPAWTLHHPQANPQHTWHRALEICRRATLVTCTTPALAERYGSAGRAVVLPNYVPKRYLELPHTTNGRPVLGWAGSVATHPDDLQATGNALARLQYPFHVVGPSDGAAGALGIPPDRVTAEGPIPFENWPEAVARLDVGIAPLAESQFNRAKSWLKPLEYSALGVAWVASDLPEYQRLNQLGAGAIARKPAAWVRELRQLLTNETWRAETVDANRQVAKTLTIEEHAWKWWEAWQHALMLERE